jgi:protein MpaA
MAQSSATSVEILGSSAGGRPIELKRLSQGPVPLLLIGGVHGDEPEGFFLVEKFADEGFWKELENKASLWVLPRLNPDGCSIEERTNANGVDLNRNMPTQDWSAEARAPRYNPGPRAGSEPETQILMKLIERIKPRLIISAHSWKPMINYNGPCRKLAELMARANAYTISDDIGYPTPGSLGTWAGWERKIPTITLEIERHSSPETIWTTHAKALLDALLFAAENESLE